MVKELLINPVVQYGFIGLAPVLLILIVWLIRQLTHVYGLLCRVIEKSNSVIEQNTAAVNELRAEMVRMGQDHSTASHTQTEAIYRMRDSMLKLRCVAEVQDKEAKNGMVRAD